MKDNDKTYLNSLNAKPVTAEMLWRANDVGSTRGNELRQKGEKPDMMAMFFAIIEEFGDGIDKSLVPVIMFRLQALSALIKDRSIGKWSMEVDGQEYSLVHEAVFEAAARARLIIDENNIAFDPAEFVLLALTFAEEDGRA